LAYLEVVKRAAFLKLLGAAGVGSALPVALGGLRPNVLSMNELNAWESVLPATDRLPALFLGHGSPMNAIEDNLFVQGFKDLAAKLHVTPAAVLCVSAHWETRGTQVTAMAQPRTIHDFGGFPQALFDVQYPAPGHPDLAHALAAAEGLGHHVATDHEWGLDHGTWSVVKHLFPDADVPVLQLSLDRSMTPAQHYALAGQLKRLRERGVLVVGSGNMVHNLRMVDWARMNDVGHGFDWALEASDAMRGWILDGNHRALMEAPSSGQRAFQLAIPTAEHYLPLLYVLGMQAPNERVSLFNDHAMAGSLTMTSVALGLPS
jgi:4,5-DOPA dioxygenase extradiol